MCCSLDAYKALTQHRRGQPRSSSATEVVSLQHAVRLASQTLAVRSCPVQESCQCNASVALCTPQHLIAWPGAAPLTRNDGAVRLGVGLCTSDAKQ